MKGVKRSVDVRLLRKVTEAELRQIARELKSRDTSFYKNTFMTYYLEGMTVGAGAWATSHYDPLMEIEILGLTLEEEADLPEASSLPDQNLLGTWLDERPYVGGRISLLADGDSFLLKRAFRDGSELETKLKEVPYSVGRRFEKVADSRSGDSWIIDRSGNLQSLDTDGIIATFPKAD